MTETENKALAQAVAAAGRRMQDYAIMAEENVLRQSIEAHARAIEQHEAFRQDVSDAVKEWHSGHGDDERVYANLTRFIIPKSDPLVEVIADYKRTKGTGEYATNKDMADALRAALAARGLEIREKQP